MQWFTVKLGRFGFGHDAGPPPSYRFAWVRLFWFDWDMWSMRAQAELDRSRRLLKAVREEWRK